MKKILFGRSPLTTLSGLILAVLIAINQMNSTGPHNWQDYLLPAAIALFGRLAGDDKNNQPPSPLTQSIPFPKDDAPASQPAIIRRRGRVYNQTRSSNGQFIAPVA